MLIYVELFAKIGLLFGIMLLVSAAIIEIAGNDESAQKKISSSIITSSILLMALSVYLIRVF